MRRRLMFLSVAVLFTFVVLCMGGEPVKAETVTLKAVTAWPKTATDNQAFFIFTDLVEQMVAQKAPGELKIQYVGGPEAVKTMDRESSFGLQSNQAFICSPLIRESGGGVKGTSRLLPPFLPERSFFLPSHPKRPAIPASRSTDNSRVV